MLKKLWRKQTNNAGADALVLDPNNIPRHVGIIMDGNGRWAQRRGLPRTMGHRAGADVLKKIVMAADDMGVKALTVYGFSTENWKRPQQEVSLLMNLIREYLLGNVRDMHEHNVRIRFIGFIGGLSNRSSDTGQSGLNGVLLAVEQFNRMGGLNGRLLEVISKDDAQNKETASAAA